jgi:HEAT repeat protein
MGDGAFDRNIEQLLGRSSEGPRPSDEFAKRFGDRLQAEAGRMRRDLVRPEAASLRFRFGVAAAAAVVVIVAGLGFREIFAPARPTCVLWSVPAPLRFDADHAVAFSVPGEASGALLIVRNDRHLASVELVDDAEIVVEPDATAVLLLQRGLVRIDAGAPLRVVAGAVSLEVRAGANVEVELIEQGDPPMKSWLISGGVGAAVGATVVAMVLHRGDADVTRPESRPVALEREKPLVVEVPASRPVVDDDRERRLAAAERKVAELEKKLAAARKESDKFAAELVQKKGVTIENIAARLAELRKGGGMSVMLSSRTADLIADLKGLGPAGTQAVLDLLKSEDAKDRFLAAKLLEDLKDPAAIPALLEAALNDSDKLASSMASHALALMEDPRAIDPLKQLVDKKKSWEQQVNALWGLVNLGDAWGLEQATAYMSDSSVSDQARAALGANIAVFMHTPEVMPIVDRTVRDFYESEQVMSIAVDYYRALNSPVARDRLQAIVNDTRVSQGIRDAASQALSQ